MACKLYLIGFVLVFSVCFSTFDRKLECVICTLCTKTFVITILHNNNRPGWESRRQQWRGRLARPTTSELQAAAAGPAYLRSSSSFSLSSSSSSSQSTSSELLRHCSRHPVRPASAAAPAFLSPPPGTRTCCLGGPGGAEQPGLMAVHEWEDWFEREEFIGQISDMRVQNLQGRKQRHPASPRNRNHPLLVVPDPQELQLTNSLPPWLCTLSITVTAVRAVLICSVFGSLVFTSFFYTSLSEENQIVALFISLK